MAMCLTTKTRIDAETETLIPTHGGGFDVATLHGDDIARTLSARHDGSPCYDRGPNVVAFSYKDSGNDAAVDLSPTLRSLGGYDANGGGQMAVAYSIMPMNSGKDYKARETDVAQPIMAGGPVGGNQGGDFVVQPISFDLAQITSVANRTRVEPGLPASTMSKNSRMHVATSAVRRLTPRECERLQGFPDYFTAIPWRGKPADQCPDGPRYKALGNSMAVPVMRWIGERIALVDAMLERIAS